MVGFLSGIDLSSNALEIARAERIASGQPLLDLANANPTLAGISFPAEILTAAAARYFATRTYAPDPRGIYATRCAISSYYRQRTPAFDIPPEQIFVTASTSEAYSLLFTLLCDPHDTVLVPDVTYPLFDLLAATRGVHLEHYRLLEQDHWAYDQGSFLTHRCATTRAVVVISPHNPTGLVLNSPLAALDELGLPVIADEVFADFAWEAPTAPAIGALHPALPVFHLNGISKMLALPDLKLGWIALNERAADQYGERLEFLNDCFLSASTLAQEMLPDLLAHGATFREQYRQQVSARLALAQQLLSEIPALTPTTVPQGGTFLFPRLTTEVDEEQLVLALVKQGVYTHPGFFYGCEHGSHFLVSAINEESTLRQALQTVARLLDTSKR